MRVISGQARGCVLTAPDGLETRPTTDRIKETIFNVIQFELDDANVLDLFAGSGAMGIEALSRGARSAAFVDISDESAEAIRKNLIKTRLAEKASVYRSDFLLAAERLAGCKFSVIFIDPPYNRGLAEQAMRAVMEHSLLSDGGLIVAELGSDEPLPVIPGLAVCKQKKFSATTILFLRNEV